MISEQVIKDKFIIDTIKKRTNELQEAQLQILSGADDKIRKKFDIPKIASSVLDRIFSLSVNDGRAMYSQKVIKQLRFLDMKKFGNMKVYNRQVLGHLQAGVANELKYGFSEEVKLAIRREMEASIQAMNSN